MGLHCADRQGNSGQKARIGDHWQEREKNYKIINVITQEGWWVRAKEDEKVEKYQDLAREVGRMWAVRKRRRGVDASIALILKSPFLGSAQILTKVLEMRRKDRILIGFLCQLVDQL